MSTESLIYATARGGSPNNPGLPPALSNLLVAQSKHETGGYTSNLYKKYNNAFGYAYYKGSLYQTGAGTIADNGQPIAAYPDVRASTYELIDWIWRKQRAGVFPSLDTITTPEQYGQLLKNGGYYGDTVTNYVNGLKRFFSDNPAAAGGAGLLIVAMVVMYIYREKIFKK